MQGSKTRTGSGKYAVIVVVPCEWCNHKAKLCLEKHDGVVCTRTRFHEGECVACCKGMTMHELRRWTRQEGKDKDDSKTTRDSGIHNAEDSGRVAADSERDS